MNPPGCSPNIARLQASSGLRRFGTAAEALAALPDLAARGGAPYRPAPEQRIVAEIAAVKRAGARYLFHDLARPTGHCWPRPTALRRS